MNRFLAIFTSMNFKNSKIIVKSVKLKRYWRVEHARVRDSSLSFSLARKHLWFWFLDCHWKHSRWLKISLWHICSMSLIHSTMIWIKQVIFGQHFPPSIKVEGRYKFALVDCILKNTYDILRENCSYDIKNDYRMGHAFSRKGWKQLTLLNIH